MANPQPAELSQTLRQLHAVAVQAEVLDRSSKIHSTERNELIRAAALAGASLEEIRDAAELTRMRVHQLVRTDSAAVSAA